MHVILLPTVPHTGTEFMVNFLQELPLVQNVVELRQLRKNPQLLAGGERGLPGLYPDRGNLAYGHIYEKELPTILSLAQWWKPVVPLRDPLLSLLTRQNRHPDQSHIHIVASWLRLVDIVDECDPCYISLDLLNTEEKRKDALEKVVFACGGGYGAWFDVVNNWARNWPKYKHNSKGIYALKEEYLHGDMTNIEQELKQELVHLRHAEPILRPFLEKQGYRDLLWWNSK